MQPAAPFVLCLALFACLQPAAGFVGTPLSRGNLKVAARKGLTTLRASPVNGPPDESSVGPVSRRTFLEQALATPVVLAAAAVTAQGLDLGLSPAEASVAIKPAPSGTKVVVLGGNGFVGSKVCETLVAAGVKVTSISRSGNLPLKWADGESWVKEVSWTAGDPRSSDLVGVMKGADAVVSCVGVIGGSDEEMEAVNGQVNAKAAQQAKAAGVKRFVYVSVGKMVPEAFGDSAFKGYFSGKKMAEEAVLAAFPSTAVLVRPTFIYGGGGFEVTPPRVPAGYGGLVDGVLSSGPLRAVAGVSPGLIKVALTPPASVENVALAIAAGALGRAEGILEGSDGINAAAKLA